MLTICIAIALLSLPRSSDSVLINTGRDLDIAIVGRGNLCLVDQETAELCYTRNGNLRLDLNGQLAVNVDGSQWLIDPPIQIPIDWDRIAVLPDGSVQTLQAGLWSNVGQLQLAVFTPTPTFDDPLAANLYSDALGPPTHNTPGKGAGVIQQGWIEQRPSTLNALAIRILLAILAAFVLYRCTSTQNSGGQDCSPHQSLSHG